MHVPDASVLQLGPRRNPASRPPVGPLFSRTFRPWFRALGARHTSLQSAGRWTAWTPSPIRAQRVTSRISRCHRTGPGSPPCSQKRRQHRALATGVPAAPRVLVRARPCLSASGSVEDSSFNQPDRTGQRTVDNSGRATCLLGVGPSGSGTRTSHGALRALKSLESPADPQVLRGQNRWQTTLPRDPSIRGAKTEMLQGSESPNFELALAQGHGNVGVPCPNGPIPVPRGWAGSAPGASGTLERVQPRRIGGRMRS